MVFVHARDRQGDEEGLDGGGKKKTLTPLRSAAVREEEMGGYSEVKGGGVWKKLKKGHLSKEEGKRGITASVLARIFTFKRMWRKEESTDIDPIQGRQPSG